MGLLTSSMSRISHGRRAPGWRCNDEGAEPCEIMELAIVPGGRQGLANSLLPGSKAAGLQQRQMLVGTANQVS